jgi:hypothetical protein
MIEGNFLATLRALHDAKVDFLVVGGLAAALNGAPVTTVDVDLVHSRSCAARSKKHAGVNEAAPTL